jgi:hypothetical protein
MAAVTVLAIAAIFITGAITGSVLLVTLASRREDRRPRLSEHAPDRTTTAGRLLTRLYVRRHSDTYPYDYPAERTPELLDEERRDCNA